MSEDVRFFTSGGKGIVITKGNPIDSKQGKMLALSSDEEVIELHKKLGEFIQRNITEAKQND